MFRTFFVLKICYILYYIRKRVNKNKNWMHYLVISFFNTNIIFQIGLTFSAWIMLQISHKIGHGCRGLLSLILCVSFNLICELFFATPVDWQSIRGMAVINRVMYKKPLVNEDFNLSHLKKFMIRPN